VQIPILPRFNSGQAKPWSSIPRINWAHPLAQNLVVYGYDAGGVVIDLVNGGVGFTTTATTAGRGSSKFGSGYKYTSGGGAIRLPFTPRINSVVPPFSIACSFFVTAVTAGNALFCLADTTASAPVYMSFDSATTMRAGFVNGADDLTYTVPSILNSYHSMVGVGASTTSIAAYFDGSSRATSANNPTSAFPAAAPIFNSFDLDGLNGNTTAGFIYYGALWTRALNDEEILQLHFDPYCFLIYPEDEIFSEWVGTITAVAPTPVFTDFYDGNFSTELVSY